MDPKAGLCDFQPPETQIGLCVLQYGCRSFIVQEDATSPTPLSIPHSIVLISTAHVTNPHEGRRMSKTPQTPHPKTLKSCPKPEA